MKTKEIKKIIKNEIESHIPNRPPAIPFPFASEDQEERMPSRRPFPFAHAFNVVFAALVVMFAVVALTQRPVGPDLPVVLREDQVETVTISAVSSLSLMSTIPDPEPLGAATTLLSVTSDTLPSVVMPYLRSVEQLLSSDDFHVIDDVSDLPDFERLMRFETKDLLGETTTYKMYYTMTLLEEDADEEEYRFTGLLYKGSKAYDVEGERSVENDEEKVSFKAYKSQDDYIESESESENGKRSYSFKVVSGGTTVSESTYEIETESDTTEVKIEFEQSGNKGEFSFEYVREDGIDLIRIDFETEIDGSETNGEMTVRMIVDPMTGTVSYRFVVDPDDDEPFEYDVEDDERDDEDDDEEDEDDEEDDSEDEEDNDEEDEDDEDEDEDGKDKDR
jgi:hypothetical protein